MWVRGLKPDNALMNFILGESHPVWVRGLKRAEESHILDMGGVAPRVGAWIETAR